MLSLRFVAHEIIGVAHMVESAEGWIMRVTGGQRPLPLSKWSCLRVLTRLFQSIRLVLEVRVGRVGSPSGSPVVLGKEHRFDKLVESVQIEIG